MKTLHDFYPNRIQLIHIQTYHFQLFSFWKSPLLYRVERVREAVEEREKERERERKEEGERESERDSIKFYSVLSF